jgi:serine phosphatase RsbU (regulator of sigma subunit)
MALSENLLADLRERLERQGRVPDLPPGWHSQTAMIASHGVRYAGDFLVADLSEDERHLEVILVDVCGKGTTAGPAALQFAGALGGLLGALPPVELFRAANDFLLRQPEEEQFATAVHLVVDLHEGTYEITSAGHPPALRYDLPLQEWVIDNARGTALGVLREPELHRTQGRLFPGEALMFYTDGVVESRTSHLDIGIAWLQRAAREAVRPGYEGAATRVIGQVDRGDDDRAVLILSRDVGRAAELSARDASTARG